MLPIFYTVLHLMYLNNSLEPARQYSIPMLRTRAESWYLCDYGFTLAIKISRFKDATVGDRVALMMDDIKNVGY